MKNQEASKAELQQELDALKTLYKKEKAKFEEAEKALIIANKAKGNRADELILAKKEKAIRAEALVIAKEQILKRADEFNIIKKNKEKIKALNIEFKLINKEYKQINEEYKQINEELTKAKEIITKSETNLKSKNKELTQSYNELIISKEKAEESDRLKSAFLANMSHEIRTPMNGILGFTGLLKEANLSGEEQQEFIKIIEKSGERLLNIINDIISIAKIEAGEKVISITETNISEQLEYIYTFFKPEADKKGIKFSYKNAISYEDLIIKTDREKVYAILTNLVKNAIKFTDKGSIEFGCDLKDNNIEFYIKDTGIGVIENRQKAIFERFIQADIEDKEVREGAGLGLSISKAYVEMLGGKIWIDSQAGKGSTFYFTIPYTVAKEEKKDNTVSDTANNANTKILNILIAEDDKISQLLITELIKKNTKKLFMSKTGSEAVEICRNNPDIDLILMDINMPIMNGFEATKQIREFNKDVIIVAQTAFALQGDKEKAIKAGCNDYISKPFGKAIFTNIMEKHF